VSSLAIEGKRGLDWEAKSFGFDGTLVKVVGGWGSAKERLPVGVNKSVLRCEEFGG